MRKTKHKKNMLFIIKNCFFRVLNIQCGLQKKIANNTKSLLFFFVCLFILGRLILHKEPFRFGLIHQIVLTLVSLIAIHMLNYCYSMSNKLLESASGLKGNAKKNKFTQRTMYSFIYDMKKSHRSIWCYIFPVFPCLEFVNKTLYLEYVPKSTAGFYAVSCGAIAFYWALVAYIHLIISIIFFRKIAQNRGDCIPLQFPNDLVSAPEWLKLWAEYFQQAEKAFFITGTLFTFEYVILMPQGIITFDPHMVINAKNNVAFVTSWMVIIFLIIIAFPILSLTIRKLFHTLLGNLKKLANNEFKFLWGKTQIMSLSDLWAYEQLSLNTIKYGTYIFETKSYIPIISTGISLLLNLAKLYESLIVPILSHV